MIHMKLKEEAAKQRRSLSALIRDKIRSGGPGGSKEEIERRRRKIDRDAREAGKKLAGFDVVKALREMRYTDQ